ncbi:MAG: hypothetical protein JSS44_10590 [Proteobacteria bacterium]|nr:hypothetical protein [Pseudomonadota bacterium]
MLSTSASIAHWYCVRSKPRAETLAVEHLQRQGYECFLPRIARRSVLARLGRPRAVIEPLFPRYLFVRADPNVQSLAAIRSTRGAVGLVRFAGEPARVADDLIKRLRRDADAQGVIVRSVPDFQRGDAVRVLDGPFAGLRGVYAQPRGEDRAVVLLQLLGGQQRVLLNATVLQGVGAARAA